MKTKEQLYLLIYEIRRQLPTTELIRTCNPCECGGTVIGMGECVDCLEKELATITTDALAAEFIQATKAVQKVSIELEAHLGT